MNILAAGLQRRRPKRALLRPYQLVHPFRRLSEKLLVFLRSPYHVRRYVADGDDEVFQQLILIARGKQRRPNGKLIKNAADAPHVDRVIVLDTKHDLWRAIVAALHIKESGSAVLAAGTEVNDLHLIILIIREQNILRLHITVNNSFIPHKFETLADLLRYYLQLLRIESLLTPLI